MHPGPYASPVEEEAARRTTLSRALGNLGGRQKSWMATAGQPPSPDQRPIPPVVKRKRGRPPNPAPAPAPAPAQQAPAVECLRSQPASNSTSPQLANVLSIQPNGRPLPSPTAALPSPSPSEDAAMDNAPTSTGALVGAIRTADGAQDNAPSLDLFSFHGASPEGRFLARTSTDFHRRAIPPPLRIQNAPTNPQHMDDITWRASLGQRQSASPSTTNQPFSPSFEQQSRTRAPYQQPLAAQQGMPNQLPVQRQTGPISPLLQTQFGPPPSLPHETAQPLVGNPVNGSVPSSVGQNMPSTRMATHTNWYTQQFCDQEIKRLVTAYKGDRESSDWKRLNALRLAVEKRDWDYLTMHQFYCILTRMPDVLPPVVKNHPDVDKACALLSEALDRNDKLSESMQLVFIQFPLPVQQLQRQNQQQFDLEVQKFTTFMTCSTHYPRLKALYEYRNFPPLVSELACDLGIRSKQLQQIVFTATVRRLWVQWRVHDPNQQLGILFERECLASFSGNQDDFYRLGVRARECGEREAESQKWGRHLISICAKYCAPLQQQWQMQHTHQRLALQSPQASTGAPHAQGPRQSLSVLHNQPPSVQQPPAPGPRSHSTHANVQQGRGQPRGLPSRPTTLWRPQPQPQPVPAAVVPSQPAPRLLPPLNVLLPQQRIPNPCRFGLHQAHLRSPVLKTQSKEPLYYFMESFLREPQRLTNAGNKVETWSFTLSSEQMARIPKDAPDFPGAPPSRNVDSNSLMLRLRCVKWDKASLPDEHAWASSDMSWIPYSYFTLNGQSLEQRKKIYYGKDMPIDLTQLIKEGTNTLEIAIVRDRTNENYRKYLVAIEILGVKSHVTITNDIRVKNYVSAATTKQRIAERLASTDDDDEIAVVGSKLTVTLFDPFSGSTIRRTPARSKACAHLDCFDLETFLQTRKRSGNATIADQWKCPICNGDARPQHLIRDGFIEEVRSQLEQQGLLQTRAILIEQDGSWRPKVEVLEGVQDPGSPEDDATPFDSRPGRSAVPEVIDLSD